MKEVNNFPNIKPTKLKEEIQKDNRNNSLKMKKINLSEYKGIKYCLLYLVIFSFIIYLFILNYLKTNDAFKDNKNIVLSAEKLCNKTIKALAECIKEKTNTKCHSENRALEYCYDEVYTMNQVCFVYISELELCLRKNNNDTKNCNSYINEVIRCGSIFRHLQIEKDILREI